VLILALACQTTDAPVTLTVLAASSLTDAMTDLEDAFEAEYPDIDVQVGVAGSQVLRLQIMQGAAADVFLSADREHIDALQRDGHITRRSVFAHNTLALIVPDDNPAEITGLEDLPDALRVVVGAPEVPIGQYTAALLEQAEAAYGPGFAESVMQRVVSEEGSVRLARARVALGEADAAIVYRTDTDTEGIVEIPIPAALNITTDYHLGVLAPARPEALLWEAFLTAEAGCAVLAAHRFTVDSCGT
jgi:molybdate transport system substrate-binding protein